ncbi:hypothetical protein ACFX2G_038584 [Malus domestica]
MPPVLKFVPRRSLGAKSSSSLERLAIMKNDKVDSATKVAPRPTLLVAETDLPNRKDEIARVGCCEKSTKPASEEDTEIYAPLRPDFLEDMDAYAKFVDDVIGVVCSSSFAKHTIEYRNIALLVMMLKTAILAAEFMLLDQKDIKAAKKLAKVMAVEAYSQIQDL